MKFIVFSRRIFLLNLPDPRYKKMLNTQNIYAATRTTKVLKDLVEKIIH